MRKYNQGQTTLEYALIITVVIVGLLAIQIYVKRGVEGKLRASSDDIGDQFEAGKTAVKSTIKNTGRNVQTVSSGVTNTTTSAVGSPGGTTVNMESGKETVDAW